MDLQSLLAHGDQKAKKNGDSGRAEQEAGKGIVFKVHRVSSTNAPAFC